MHLEFTHVFQKEAGSICSVLGWGDVSIFSQHSRHQTRSGNETSPNAEQKYKSPRCKYTALYL